LQFFAIAIAFSAEAHHEIEDCISSPIESTLITRLITKYSDSVLASALQRLCRLPDAKGWNGSMQYNTPQMCLTGAGLVMASTFIRNVNASLAHYLLT
jgi:hypothetical protein